MMRAKILKSRRVVIRLKTRDAWSEEFLATLGVWKEEIERPSQQPVIRSKDPFA
jgi:hypothetical protein